MKKTLVVLGVLLAVHCVLALDIVRNGQACCVIVGEAGSTAVQELKVHLETICGGTIPVCAEGKEPEGVVALYVGNTAFAQKHDLAEGKFLPGQWCVKTVGKDIVFAGWAEGAVYHFLEDVLGCHWFTFESSVIPKMKDITLDTLNLHGKPAYSQRLVLTPNGVHDMDPVPLNLCDSRNRGTDYGGNGYRLSPQTRPHHTFYAYVDPDTYFKEHPEYFGMNESGIRVRGKTIGDGGQLCLTHPETLRIAVDSLKKFIRADREQHAANMAECPNLYDFSQNDSTSYICRCPSCRKITEAEGSESGLVIHFMNQVLELIGKEYPDVYLRTFAYNSTEAAPRSVRPHRHLLIQWCDLYTRSDCYRPLTSRFNAEQLAKLQAWHRIGAQLIIWDYWNMAFREGTYFNPPRIETLVDAIPGDIRTFHQNGAIGYFGEAEAFFQYVPPNFYDLQKWLALKLLENPEQDSEALITLFMTRHYGPAAPAMREFLTVVRKAVREEPDGLYYIRNLSRKYQTPEFLRKCYDLLQKARGATPADSPYCYRVEKEMLTPLALLIKSTSIDIGVPREEICRQYREIRQRQIRRYCLPDRQAKLLKAVEEELLVIPIPERFKNVPAERIRLFAYTTMPCLKEDSEAFGGRAMSTGPQNTTRLHSMKLVDGCYPTSFGLYDWERKNGATIHITEIPSDEKYHWYRIGRYDLGPSSVLWGWWWMTRVPLSSAYGAADGMEHGNRWVVWIHVKIQGPAYVKDSTKPNDVLLDMVALVK